MIIYVSPGWIRSMSTWKRKENVQHTKWTIIRS